MILGIDEAARRLRAGEVVAYPTETVYGLGAAVDSAGALTRLVSLKGRDPRRPLSVLVRDLEGLASLLLDLPPPARALAGRFWPGPLTLVLPAAAPWLSPVAREGRAGFRCSPHPVARALLEACGRPVVSTSCNRSGQAPCRSAEAVESLFGTALPIAGGGPAGGLAPSTVVAVGRDGAVELLREGPVPFAELAA